MFDNTDFYDTVAIDANIAFNVTSARPYYPSSDDALVDWVKNDKGDKN